MKKALLKVKFGNLGENQAQVFYGWNVNNGRYTTIKEGNPAWDNTNWLVNKRNPFEISKTLDIEFDNIEL